VSEPFEAAWGDGKRWFVVFCLDRMPGRDVPFDAVAAEIDAGLAARPITPLETTAYTLRWRSGLDGDRDAGQPAGRSPAPQSR
jgi:hypothetical protein